MLTLENGRTMTVNPENFMLFSDPSDPLTAVFTRLGEGYYKVKENVPQIIELIKNAEIL